jgi:hypothetical protein
MRSFALRSLFAAAATATVVATTGGTAAAFPGPCPAGEPVCVYLPPGTYVLGNPVSVQDGVAPSTNLLLEHCNTSTGQCDQLYLNLPGVTFASAQTALLTLYVPGEGVALAGTTPRLYVGVPTATVGSPALGLTLNVQGTTIVLYDTILGPFSCTVNRVPPNGYVNGWYGGCGVNLTVTV